MGVPGTRPTRDALTAFREILRRFPNRYLVALGLTAMVLNTVLGVVVGHLLKLLVDAAVAGFFTAFLKLLLLDVAIHVVRAFIAGMNTYVFGKYSEEGVARLREEAVSHLTKASLHEIERFHSGEFTSRLTNDLRWIRTFMGYNLSTLVYSPLEVLLVFAYLSSVNWKLTLVTLVTAPLLVGLGQVFSPAMYRLGKELQERLGSLSVILKDVLSGIRVARAYNLASVFDGKYQEATDRAVATARTLAHRHVLLDGTTGFMSIVPYILLYGLGGYWVMQGEMTPGGLVAFVSLSSQLTKPLSLMPALVGRAHTDMAAANRVFEIFKLVPERTTGSVPDTSWASADVVVEASGLSFSYPGRKQEVLRDVTFQVRKGETLALVGPSGSGKSTLAKLILGLYEGYSGVLDVFGVPVREWDLTSLRANIAFVAQDPFLFPGSIRDNIACGRPGASDEDIIAAAMAAGVHDFVARLPKGYETEVGELGGRLSGGEKQRISIARAMLRDAQLLVLDEPTSSLDAESEALVEEALWNLSKGRTTIVIAHRLSTIRNADRILVLDRGTVVETGTHEELMARDGLYKKLYRSQIIAPEGGISP